MKVPTFTVPEGHVIIIHFFSSAALAMWRPICPAARTMSPPMKVRICPMKWNNEYSIKFLYDFTYIHLKPDSSLDLHVVFEIYR